MTRTIEKRPFTVFGRPQFSHDSRLLAFATTDNLVKVWEIEKDRFVHSFAGHSWVVNDLGFSKDGNYLASSSDDGDTRVWDLRTGREVYRPLRGHGSGVASVRFSSLGQTLITSGFDRTVRFWHVPTGREMLWFDRTFLYHDRVMVNHQLGSLSPSEELFVVWDDDRAAIRVESIATLAQIQAKEKRKEKE